MSRRAATRRASSSATRRASRRWWRAPATPSCRASPRRWSTASRSRHRARRRSPIDGAVIGRVREADEAIAAAAMAAAAGGFRGLERHAGRSPRRRARARRRPARSEPRPPDRAAAGARAARRSTMRSPRCARRSTSAATTPPRRARSLAPQLLPGPTGETQRTALSRPRRVRLHQPVEFPARDLHRPGRRGACRRQCGGGQARRADAADRRRGGAAPASRPAFRQSALHLVPGDGKIGAALVARSARRRRRLHRLDRGGARHQPRARRQGRADRAADRRDRRHQRDDRRCHRVARAGDRRRRDLGVPLGRPALLGAAAALRAGGCRRPHDRDDRGRGARS